MNRNTFPEFSQFFYQEFSIFHSSLVVNYPSQASFELEWVLLTAFLFLRAHWIVSAGPSGHLKQSIQRTVFEQRTTSTRWRALKPRKLFRNCPNIIVTSFVYFGAVSAFRRRLTSDQNRKIFEKPQVWNTFGPRSPTVGGRGRPPFVENIAKNIKPHSLPL